MDTTKKVEKEEIEATGEVTVEPEKPKFGARVKGFFARNKKKFIIGGLAAAGIAAGALVKNHRDKLRAEEEADEAERTALAEDWYERGLAAGRALPEATDSEVTEDANEEES